MDIAARIDGFREPLQARSRGTLDRIVEAAETLLLEGGPDRVTVRNVVERAGTSVGAFYTRFDTRDDAVAYVQERFWEEIRRRWADWLDPAAWSGVPASRIVVEVVRAYCRVALADRRSRAHLVELLARRDPTLLARVRTLDGQIATMMGRLVEERAAELGHPDPRRAAEDGFRRVLSAVRGHLLFDADGDPADDRALILSLVRMYGGMLGVPDGPVTYAELVRRCA